MALAVTTIGPTNIFNDVLTKLSHSDFNIANDQTNSPFFSLGTLRLEYQPDIKIKNCQGNKKQCRFSYVTTNQKLFLPVWVGQKNMVLAGETLAWSHLIHDGKSTDIFTPGALLAWLMQISDNWQIGAGTYWYADLGKKSITDNRFGTVNGIIARYRHHDSLHGYLGVVYVKDNDSSVFPYLGVNWDINQEWNISALLPWPAINYSPTKNWLFSLGASPAANRYSSNSQGKIIDDKFNKVDLQLSAERRLYKILWGKLGIGFSGFASFWDVTEGGFDPDFTLQRTPFISFSLNLHP